MNDELITSLLLEEGIKPELFSSNSKVITQSVITNLSREKYVYRALDYLVKRISNTITKAIAKEQDLQIIKAELKALVSDKYIKWDLQPLSDELAEFADIFSRSRLKGETNLCQFICEGQNYPTITCITSRSFKAKDGGWKVRSTSKRCTYEMGFSDLSYSLSLILLYNALIEYIEHNRELVEPIFVKSLTSVSRIACDHVVEQYLSNLKANNPCISNLELSVRNTNLFCEGYIRHFFIPKDIFIGSKNIMAKSLFFHTVFILNLIKDMYGVTEDIIGYVSYTNETERTYAASYELKKNIPQKTLNKMASSSLNKYFSEIEVDELMDLKVIDEIEDEYIGTFSNMFPTHKAPSLRFRRLGKYKAAGLFFPYQNAVCVDINSPGSMIHELFHWLDYNYYKLVGDTSLRTTYRNRLSSSFQYSQIVNAYKIAMEKYIESLDTNDSIYQLWNGNTRYNKKYYFETTEIFARLGEMYIKKVYGSSILCNGGRLGYPEDAELEQLSFQFFKKIFDDLGAIHPQDFKQKEFIKREKIASNLFFKVDIAGQMSLF